MTINPINPYERRIKEALNNGADKKSVYIYQQKAEAYKEGCTKWAEEIKELRAEIKAWIKEVHSQERKGKQLMDKLSQLEKDWVLEVMKEENRKHK